jgi:hypothetical protein
MKARLFFIAVLVTATSCKNHKYITSSPPGAKVIIDGKPVGVTPYAYRDHRPFWSERTVELTKQGYQKHREEISRTETLNPGPLVATFFFFPCALWAGGYRSELHVNLRQSSDSVNAYTQTLTPPVKKTKAEKRAVVERLYESGALTRKEYLDELDWIDSSEDDQQP